MIPEVIGSVFAALVSTYLWTRFADRVKVKRIVDQADPDCEALVDLYERLFDDDGTNYSAEEILEFFGSDENFSEEHHVQAENIILTAKFKGGVVGLLFCHFYPDAKKAIISYFGVDPGILEARRSAATKLLTRLRRILLDGSHSCDFVFFDLQGVEPDTPKEEARERRARPRRFKQQAKVFGLNAGVLNFDYVCPKVSLTHETREYPFSLVCVPIRGVLSNPVPRAEVLEFLRFIHLDCYGDLYRVNDERFEPYRSHLLERLEFYEKTLPTEIRIT